MERDPITFTLLGEPTPFARMRLSKSGIHYMPADQRNTMAALRVEANNAMRTLGVAMFDEPVSIVLLAEFGVPASWSKKRQEMAIRGEIRPAKRPDLDNLYKLAADALNKLAYRDDALVVDLRCTKIYGIQPKLIVTVQPAEVRMHKAVAA